MTISEYLNSANPPASLTEGKLFLALGRELSIRDPEAFLAALRNGTPQAQHNAMFALRENGYEVWDIGEPGRTRYSVKKPTGEQFTIEPEQQLDWLPDLTMSAEARIKLADAFRKQIKTLQLTQIQVHKRTGMGQAKVSAINNNRLKNVSIERLMSALVALGYDVQINVSKAGASGSAGLTTHINGE